MKELTVPANVESIAPVTDFVNAELDNYDCAMKARIQLDVAIDELFGNIAHYAYQNGDGTATVRLEITQEPLCATLTFIDNGKPFNPLETQEPDTALSAQERKIGGLGIFIVKKTMDRLDYRYCNGQNIVTIEKKLR